MPFNFKKLTKLYLVYSGSIYNIDIENEVSIGQTFTESSTSVNTVHATKFFERSTIAKANPASFSFKMPALQQDDLKLVFTRLIDCNVFDLYVQSTESTFKISNCVLTNGTFNIERNAILSMNISGEGEQLSRVGNATYTIPGFLVPRSETRKYLVPHTLNILLDAADISGEVFSISAELQNDASWNGYETVHKGLVVSDNSNVMYPSGFTISKKIFAGSIGRYLIDGANSTFLNFNKDVSLQIKAGETIEGTFYGFDFNMPNCSFTNRLTVSEVFSQNFDWRLTTNTALSSILYYNTLSQWVFESGTLSPTGIITFDGIIPE